MNKKGILFFFFFFFAFSFCPAFLAFRASRSQASRLSLAFSFLLPTLFSSSLSFRICFASWTQPLLQQMIFWVCTSPMSYQAKSMMSSLLLIFLLSFPNKHNKGRFAAHRNSLHLSIIADWGGLKHAFCYSFPNKSCRQDMISISLFTSLIMEAAQLNM